MIAQEHKEMTMEAGLDYLASPVVMKFVRYINSAAAALQSAGLSAATQEHR